MEIENIEWKFLKMRRLLLAKAIRIFPFGFFTILSIGIESLKGAFSFGDFNSELFFGLIVFGIILNTLQGVNYVDENTFWRFFRKPYGKSSILASGFSMDFCFQRC
ncbi:MAG: hypothetical protein PHH92_09635 [Aliarcobacter skirrowii]|uniref:hypothetical protein n=1 Tax=Aliarcobacter skirrowii TaxID=28200 RepID=UPI00242E782E|nr:hypothetical protein [Aliarcobacter skirrowii]MDD3497631.1 hypothetical protein [Aliarcobacter skirrowii]